MKKSLLFWCLGIFIFWLAETAVNFLRSGFNAAGVQALIIACLYLAIASLGAFFTRRIQPAFSGLTKRKINSGAFSAATFVFFAVFLYLYLWLNDKNPDTLAAPSSIITDILLLIVCLAFSILVYRIFTGFRAGKDIIAAYIAFSVSFYFILVYLPEFNWDIYHESVWSLERFLTFKTLMLNALIISAGVLACFLIYRFRRVSGAFLISVFIFFFLYSISGSLGIERPAAKRAAGPNILIFLMDALRADHLGCYGYANDTTPNIDRFAQSSALFENCITPNPITQLVMPSLLTSRYNTFKARKDFSFMNSLIRIQEILKSNGYLTASFAGFHSPYKVPGLDKGFDYQFSPYGAYYEYFIPKIYITFLNAITTDKNSWGVPYCRIENGLFSWLIENKNRNFFVYVHSADTHAPYWVNPGYKRRFFKGTAEEKFILAEEWRTKQSRINPLRIKEVIDIYDDSINSTDINFGKLIDKLKDLGILDNTLIVVVSDHGEGFLEHGNAHHGRSSFEEETHVPLIIRYPALIKEGIRVPALVSSLDIVPTILDAAGIKFTGPMDGISFLDLIRKGKEAKGLTHREYVFTEKDGSFVAVRTKKWKLTICEEEKRGLLGSNSLAHKKMKELYNLESDPKELNNVYEEKKDEKEIKELEAIQMEHIRFMHSLGGE